MEEWKQIPGWPYEIGSLGHVRRIGGRILKTFPNARNYLSLSLWNNGHRLTTKVHRLVALAFLPNPENLSVVNHKNGDKHDNRVENLEWCTPRHNALHAINELGLEYGATKLLSKSQARRAIKLLLSGHSIGEVARRFGVNRGIISKINLGQTYRSVLISLLPATREILSKPAPIYSGEINAIVAAARRVVEVEKRFRKGKETNPLSRAIEDLCFLLPRKSYEKPKGDRK